MLLESPEILESPEVQSDTHVAVAFGDGVGPEIMAATLRILEAAVPNFSYQAVSMGERVYLSGQTSGIHQNAWDEIRKAKVLLKAPITTPQGSGYKSLNVTMRKSLGLFANVRPTRALSPYVHTLHPDMDVVIIRENEEDLYAGIEHQQTEDVVQCLKLITKPGTERIVRYAFEYARANGRKKVTCMVKDNIMKHTDGLFSRVFREIGESYPDIEQEVQIIDIGTARLAAHPERYDVIVTANLYGDIISDVAAELAGSVGMGGSANIGSEIAMFEAIHGSAPDIAGQNIANPSGLIQAATMMLNHLGLVDESARIQNAWLRTLEDGIHTADIFHDKTSQAKVSTEEFATAVIDRLGQEPQRLKSASCGTQAQISIPPYQREVSVKRLVGVDVFLDWAGDEPDRLGEALDHLETYNLRLKMITNRGVKVYPGGLPETFLTDHWRCRFVSRSSTIDLNEPVYEEINQEYILDLLNRLHDKGFEVIKTENLYKFDGVRAFSLGQGE